jgi:hypothetical protein
MVNTMSPAPLPHQPDMRTTNRPDNSHGDSNTHITTAPLLHITGNIQRYSPVRQ